MADEVKIEYDQTKQDVANLIGYLQNELETEPDDLNWGHVGDLKSVKDNLLDILVSMTGFKKEEIENSLQEK
jgi:hypothetical protein